MIARFRLSGKFFSGIALIILSFVISKIAQIMFMLNLKDPQVLWWSIAIYTVSWVPFVIGVWWVGREYADAVQKYFSVKFYHESFKKGVRKTKRVGKKVHGKTKQVIFKSKRRVLRR